MSQKLGETWDSRQGRSERAQNTSAEDRKGIYGPVKENIRE